MANKNYGSLWVERLLQLPFFPNSRDDSDIDVPLNFLYTDPNGDLKSAPVGEISIDIQNQIDDLELEETMHQVGATSRGADFDGALLLSTRDNNVPHFFHAASQLTIDFGAGAVVATRHNGVATSSTQFSTVPEGSFVMIYRSNSATNYLVICISNVPSPLESITSAGNIISDVNGDLIVGERFNSSLPAPVGNNGTAFLTALELEVDIVEAGNYQLEIFTVTSNNAATDDFRLQVLQDNDVLTNIQIEHKDVGGAGIVVTNLQGGTFNSGTNQRVPYPLRKIVPLTAGTHVFEIQIACGLAGSEATLYEADIQLERWS